MTTVDAGGREKLLLGQARLAGKRDRRNVEAENARDHIPRTALARDESVIAAVLDAADEADGAKEQDQAEKADAGTAEKSEALERGEALRMAARGAA